MAVVSSHTLNGSDGTHAGGIAVKLINLTTGVEMFSTEMDAGGRLSETVDLNAADPTDRFELTFQTGPYWDAQGYKHARITHEIVLRFVMPDPQARYHMPLILSPNSYSCWASLPER